jgi:glutamyl-tRNA reductase
MSMTCNGSATNASPNAADTSAPPKPSSTKNLAGSWLIVPAAADGPVIARLTREFDQKRQAIVHDLFSKLNGKLSDSDRRTIDGAFRLLQNQLLHGPISALAEASTEEQSHRGLLEALRKLFRLSE